MIGNRIKETREKNNLTQSALSKKLGISRSAVNAWEMGISVPSAQYLVELSELFNVSTDYLLGLSEKETIDISDLSDEEKQMIYSLINYFKKYGKTFRLLSGQMNDEYDIINKISEERAKEVTKEILEHIISTQNK